jgi:hypothetical protein
MEITGSREYKIDIEPRILEFLGPSLYTNIYFVLAELIANSYDADASNVYIIQDGNKIVIEDDGTGMSYSKGDISKYLKVAEETRTDTSDSYTVKGRRKMGRKGVGKLAALAVSEKVLVMTQRGGDKSGFILSRHVDNNGLLVPISESDISFEKITGHGTSIVMLDPEYELNKGMESVKGNLLKIFPLVSKDFKIHIHTGHTKFTINDFNKEMIQSLGGLVLVGEEFHYLSKYFNPGIAKGYNPDGLLVKENEKVIPITLSTKKGKVKQYDMKIRGWIGFYRTTRDRKNESNDFPDNFISLMSNGKLGEYNILPTVGRNRLVEVFVVGQLHVDLFEETELPDMALSNRQGYKSDDKRYQEVIKYIRDDLLLRVLNMRVAWAKLNMAEKDRLKQQRLKVTEDELKRKVDNYKITASKKIANRFEAQLPAGADVTIESELNSFLPILGLKQRIDSQKKKILISHTGTDKPLCDVVYKMLSFNGAPDSDIIYTNCDNEECRVPEDAPVYDYLREFFVDSYSNEKILVLYVTSDEMAKSWNAVAEVGAGWITRSHHKIFNTKGHSPKMPLDTRAEWQSSIVSGGVISMTPLEFDKFIVKIRDVCDKLGYSTKNKDLNEKELMRYVSVV